MLFSSIPFLYYFLPATVISYFLISWCVEKVFIAAGAQRETAHKASIFTKNTILLLFSLLFYGWGEPICMFLMIVTILVAWGTGWMVGISKTQGMKRFWTILSVTISLGFLAIFKYADFFVDTFNDLANLNVPMLKDLPFVKQIPWLRQLLGSLPIGISFYTFQSMSYTIDVYRGEVPVQKNPIYFGAYVTMFPQLIAGPIVRYRDVARELNDRHHDWNRVALGLRRFIIGLAKKIIIADGFALLTNIFRESGGQSVVFYWMYAIAFAFNIYFDFSGYSDMAIGLGKMFGFNFIENFNYPYTSVTVAEFWRRWHMSLGSWFRDYVYIPLGGNRVGKGRWLFNTLAVWFLTGMWHGATWNFILWGLLYFVCLVAEKWIPALQKLPNWTRRVMTLTVVCLGFVLFNATGDKSLGADLPQATRDLIQAGKDFAGIFGFGGLPFITAETVYYLRGFAVLFILGFVGCTPLVKNTANRLLESKKLGTVAHVLEPIVLILLLLVCTGYLVDGSFSPFLYFRF